MVSPASTAQVVFGSLHPDEEGDLGPNLEMAVKDMRLYDSALTTEEISKLAKSSRVRGLVSGCTGVSYP